MTTARSKGKRHFANGAFMNLPSSETERYYITRQGFEQDLFLVRPAALDHRRTVRSGPCGRLCVRLLGGGYALRASPAAYFNSDADSNDGADACRNQQRHCLLLDAAAA